MTKEQLESKYGITIVDDSFYNSHTNKVIKCYRMYSADGCHWENGLPTIKAVEAECRKWAKTLIRIKAYSK